jgi:hypothetical protein
MCDKVYGYFECADKHRARGENAERLSHIQKCATAGRGPVCVPLGEIIDTNLDGTDRECPECRGETPPESP